MMSDDQANEKDADGVHTEVEATATGESADVAEMTDDAPPSPNDDDTPTGDPPTPPPRAKRNTDKRFVTELRADEVRWFYKRQPDDTKWRSFNGADSLQLEVRWRQKNDVSIDRKTVELLAQQCKRPTVVVLDGLYKLSETGTEVTPIFWNDAALELRRGTWFLAENYQPINPEYAAQIEEHHLKHFRGQNIPDGQVFFDKDNTKKLLLTELKLEHSYARWNSVIDVTLFSTSAKNRFLRYLALSKGASLVRGYKEAACLTDSPKPIDHIVFVIHGIGQKGYEGLIAKHTEVVRDIASGLFEKHFDKATTRPIFLPVEWRTRLILDNGLTDHITLRYMEAIRNALNSTAMDIMYYQSPLYRQEIVGGMVRVLNDTYTMFLEHNPDFNGKVSFFAHSLGSVMAYDIITGWSPLLLYDQFVTHTIAQHIAQAEGDNRQALEQLQDARAQIHNIEGGLEAILRSSEGQLKFKVALYLQAYSSRLLLWGMYGKLLLAAHDRPTVTNLFCIGSPLAVFLAMRGQEATKVIPSRDDVEHIFNIFHPADPVAYRLEPLLHPDYRHIRPVRIYGLNSSKLKIPYSNVPMEMHKRSLRQMLGKGSKKDRGNIIMTSDTEVGVDATKANDRGDRLDEQDLHEDDDDDSDMDSTPDSSMRNQPGSGESSPRSGTPVSEAAAPSSKRWWSFGSKSEKKTTAEAAKDVAKDVIAEGAEAIMKLTPLQTILEGISQDLKLERRLDFALRQGLTEVSYWSVLKSHFTYWTHHDLIMFMLTQMYGES